MINILTAFTLEMENLRVIVGNNFLFKTSLDKTIILKRSVGQREVYAYGGAGQDITTRIACYSKKLQRRHMHALHAIA
ncbi:MAG: hypothetical protein P8179_19935 [Candidatus Thiodiazotropha sp.]